MTAPPNSDTTDDIARSLVAACHEREFADGIDDDVAPLIARLACAHRGSGRFVVHGCIAHASEDVPCDDTSGRAIWAAGTAAAELPDVTHRQLARELFDNACGFRSSSVQATALAVVGAARVLARDPFSLGALTLLIDGAKSLDRDDLGPTPTDFQFADSAILGEALILLGTTLGLESYRAEGLRQLRELVALGAAHWRGFGPAPFAFGPGAL
jgi:hypothetical protein